MATLNDLYDVFVVGFENEELDFQPLKDYITQNGPGIYSISTEYGENSIFKESFATLEEFREDFAEGFDEDFTVEEYLEDFNEPSDIERGFIFGETFFTVLITEI